jgi:tRNA G18 (ribose-2'-O)-methylase SpoU
LNVEEVDDPSDPRLADYVDLRAGWTPESLVIVEGVLAGTQLAGSPYPVRSVLTAPKKLDEVLALGLDAPVYVAPLDVVRATVGFNLHRGVVASADRPPPLDPAAVIDRTDRLLVLEGVNDHENLGGLFRNARAFGVGGVLLDPRTADPLYRRSVRVSLGHVLRMPFARFDEDWPAGLEAIKPAGFTLVALTPAGDETIDDLAAHPPAKVAVLVGAEGSGLTDPALAIADRRVRIPMAPGVDSLNVATATAVVLSRLGAPSRGPVP